MWTDLFLLPGKRHKFMFRTAEDFMMLTNQMKIKKELEEKVQEELAANSLMDLQLVFNIMANGILHSMCQMKSKSLLKCFENFRTSWFAEVLPAATRAGFSAICHLTSQTPF